MHPKNKEHLESRVVNAAEAALADHHYVSAVDVLIGTRLLDPADLQAWKRGRVDFLERVIQGNLNKISLAMSLFRQWARAKGLEPSETRYMRSGLGTGNCGSARAAITISRRTTEPITFRRRFRRRRRSASNKS